jgi:hypothetical protein
MALLGLPVHCRSGQQKRELSFRTVNRGRVRAHDRRWQALVLSLGTVLTRSLADYSSQVSF